jgi:hypothetical protein
MMIRWLEVGLAFAAFMASLGIGKEQKGGVASTGRLKVYALDIAEMK